MPIQTATVRENSATAIPWAQADATEVQVDAADTTSGVTHSLEDQTDSAPVIDPSKLHDLAKNAASLGFEVVDVSGFLDELQERSDLQIGVLQEASGTAQQVVRATKTVLAAADEVKEASQSALDLATGSVEKMRESATRSTDVATWVASVADEIDILMASLKDVEKNNDLIGDIASQVNFLSINARIEAGRAGDAGRGFAVIAQEVNELSGRTNGVAEKIRNSVRQLHGAIDTLSKESSAVRGKADQVINDSEQTHANLSAIADQIQQVSIKSRHIDDEAERATEASSSFLPVFEAMSKGIEDTSGRISGVTERTHALIDRTEYIVQSTVHLGGATEDATYIERVQADAQHLSALLEDAVNNRRISLSHLMARDYTPISGTRPEQVMAPFTKLTDELFTPIQEKALTLSDKVVFCAAVNLDGYLPTHNTKFSKPQSDDAEWNMGNCRNRRIFNDRVGLKSGRNKQPFLLQVYRRDMGKGNFKLMKDVSAPIWVGGQHWGGLRLAYDA